MPSRTIGGRCTPWKRPGGRAPVDQQREPLGHGVRVVEIGERQHRAEAIDELDRALAVGLRAAGPPQGAQCAPSGGSEQRFIASVGGQDVGVALVGDGVVVDVVDRDVEVQHVTGPGRAQEARLVGERRHGPAAEVDVRHRDPRRQLSDRFGHQALREAFDVRGNRERAARALAGRKLGDAVDEREGREMIRHERQAALRCACTTSLQNVSGVKRRGMSATFIGDLKRSAGTSDR